MQLIAKLTQLLPIQTVQETEGQYTKKICVSIWGDKINEG